MASQKDEIVPQDGSALRCAISATALLFVLAASPPAIAQRGPAPPDFSRTERTFEAIQAEQRRSKGTAVPLPQAPSTSTQADAKPLFRLTAVTVSGATSMTSGVIADAYRPYLGKTVSQADLVAIAGRITDLYRTAGYHLSRAVVPPQDIKGGRIQIRVIEGYVADVVVKGDRAAQFAVARVLKPVTADQPSQRASFERVLLLLNDLPGLRISDTVLEEIQQGTGCFRLIVRVETWLNYTAVSLDNRGTAAIGPLQSYLSSSFNSVAIPGDTAGANLSTAPNATEELRFGRVFYNTPIGNDGARLGAIASLSDIRPGDQSRAVDTDDKAQIYEIRGSVVPLRSRDASLWLSAAASFGDFQETSLFGLNYRDHIRTISLAADYQRHDQLDGWNYLTLTARQGLDIFNASRAGDPFLSREDGSGTFSKLELAYTRYQKLSDIWSLKVSAVGQLASRGLLASQEFYLGSAFGRGYWGADSAGDNAMAGSLEIRYDQAVSSEFLKGYQPYSYVDKSVAWNFHSGGANPLTLSLIGSGVRFYLSQDLQAGVEVSTPLEYRTPTEQPHDLRVFFYVSKFFRLCPGSAEMRCS